MITSRIDSFSDDHWPYFWPMWSLALLMAYVMWSLAYSDNSLRDDLWPIDDPCDNYWPIDNLCDEITGLLIAFYHMMICGSCTLLPIDLWGSTLPPFTYTSSLTVTSSPNTQTFSILTHWPTLQLQPMMHESIQLCWAIRAPLELGSQLLLLLLLLTWGQYSSWYRHPALWPPQVLWSRLALK